MRRLAEWADARLNPIMVKEVYQAFRSRALSWTAAGALGIPLLVYLLLPRHHGYLEGDAGLHFFRTVVIALGVVCWGALPIKAGVTLQEEIRTRTHDLLSLTALSPWDLVLGRFQASMLQVLLFLSFSGPFAVAAVLMGGVGVPQVLSGLLLVVLVAAFLAALVLALSSPVALVQRLRVLTWAAFAMLVSPMSVLGAMLVNERLPSVHREPWWLLWSIALVLLLVVLMLRLAADVLSPPGQRHFARSKLAMLVVLVLSLIPAAMDRDLDEDILAAVLLPCYALLWLFGGAVRASGVDGHLPRLLRNGQVASAALAAAITAVLLPAVVGLGDADGVGLILLMLSHFILISGLAAFSANGDGPRYVLFFVVLLVLQGVATGLYWAMAGDNPPEAIAALLPLTAADDLDQPGFMLWLIVPTAFGLLAMRMSAIAARARERSYAAPEGRGG